MLVLHAHWQPPRKPTDPGGVLFWAETPAALALPKPRGRLSAHPRPKEHPFCAPPSALQLWINGQVGQAILRLPSTRSGPQPSPGLVHNWELGQETAPTLAPWIISGCWLPAAQALTALATLPSLAGITLAADACYWHTAASLALETLAAQKLVPVLAPAGEGIYHARWLPVLDEPLDAPRLALLETAMPPVCRAESQAEAAIATDDQLQTQGVPARILLDSFLKTMCDAQARMWGRQAVSRSGFGSDGTTGRWLTALFGDNPRVEASPAQLQSLESSLRAWMRNLHVAGDRAFRIAFRLEAPGQQADRPPAPRWQLHYLLQARDDPSLLVDAETVWQARGSVLKTLDRRFERPQEKLLAGLGYAARLFPPIAGSLKTRRPTALSLDTQAAYIFLREASPLLEGAGFGILVPPWWNKPGSRLGVRLRMKPVQKQGVETNQGKLSMENLVSYRWELSIGETALTRQEFEALAALKSPLVQIRGQWVQIDAEQIETAIHFWERKQLEGEMSLLDALQIEASAQIAEGLPIDAVTAEGWLGEWLERLKQPDRLAADPDAALPQPQGLHGQLRPYQRFGYSWLHFLRRWGLGACLADDMGLGKTIQTLALLLFEKEQQGQLPAPTLLVCPTSVVTNWEREVSRFAPALTTLVHQGPGRLRSEEFSAAARAVDLVLTSYALVRQDDQVMKSISWYGVVLDEAQNIKNPAAKQTQMVGRLPAGFRLALTGTPVENRLTELWSIMQFLNPGYLGSRQAFRREFALPIERYSDSQATERLKKLVNPFILRRVKTDPRVIQDLPEKQEMKVYCHLTEEQATLYQAVVRDSLQKVESSEGIERRGLVLSLLMQLKQICNHPAQFLHQASPRPARRSATAAASRIGGARSGSEDNLGGRSGKLERLVEMLEETLSVGDRALVFTQYAEMGELLSAYLPQALGTAVQFLHGGTPANVRDEMVRRFQEDQHAPPVFILSLKAGGTGLNLTRANHVFHFDRWWNPAVEDQATDRAFRIGQTRNVQVHKYITVGTLEEMVDEMIESKKGLAQAVVGSGENWLTELSTEQLREVVQLRKDA